MSTCRDINNGVYRTGFAETQEIREKVMQEVYAALDRVEEILSKQRYLTGDQVTEADLRLYPTLVRFDTVYYYFTKVSKNSLVYCQYWQIRSNSLAARIY